MKKTLVFLTSVLFIALMAVSCYDQPGKATGNNQNEIKKVDNSAETPAEEIAEPETETDTIESELVEDEILDTQSEDYVSDTDMSNNIEFQSEDKKIKVDKNKEAQKARIEIKVKSDETIITIF